MDEVVLKSCCKHVLGKGIFSMEEKIDCESSKGYGQHWLMAM